MRDLKNKLVVITGAAGGIGSALARELANCGCRLLLTDINEPGLAALTAELQSAGKTVSQAVLDVRSRAAWTALAQQVLDEHGGANVLVNNAGLTVFGSFTAMSSAEIDLVFDVNVRGVVQGCEAFAPQLLAKGNGHIVNLSSMAGLFGIPTQATYAASKYAVRGLSAGLRQEFAPAGVGVTAVLPGAVATPFLQVAPSYDPKMTTQLADLMLKYGYPPARLARRIRRAIVRDKHELIVGAEAVMSALVMRVAPWLIRWSLGMMVKQMPVAEPADQPTSIAQSSDEQAGTAQ